MKSFVLVVLCCSVALALPSRNLHDKAEACTPDNCKENCRCSSNVSPLALDKTPQLISLTFDDAVQQAAYETYLTDILARENPDGANIGATFFVPHEYTDYQVVNQLYVDGFEIADHSITKNSQANYWKNLDEDTLYNEFEGQKEIISKFANIPYEDIVGVRTPQLLLNGNASINAFVKSKFSYDSSWATLPSKPLFPYSLNYLSTQQCPVNQFCPNEPFPDIWILPIVDLNGEGHECNNLGECGKNGTDAEITSWLVEELDKIKKATRVPLTLRINAIWFQQSPGALKGFLGFLDTLKDDKEVFLVSQKQVYDWIKKPVPIEEFKTEVYDRIAECKPVTCQLEKEDAIRYMNSCVDCPEVYPWLGNPTGK